MKKSLLLFLILALAGSSAAQTVYKTVSKTSADKKYTWTEVENDPSRARFYTLPNGLTVILAENHLEPKVAALFAVKAGGKHDPADNTGLAHYLEHMLFKGTDRFGTLDFAKEQVELKKIDSLYGLYNQSKDAAVRKKIYHKIDSVSGVAATFAIANEYDKMMNSIGSTFTNAFTSYENTTYMENFSSNNLEKFLAIQQERFRNPILRLFHTELEAVYEEKNISLDNGSRKVNEAMFASLFKSHPYGSQTVIGTVEHLKNPSLQAIRDYYSTYYVPNNMALILSGDLNPDETIALVDKYFGAWEKKPIPKFTFKKEKPRTKREEITVKSPDEASVAIGYRIPGVLEKEAATAEIVSSILYNGKSGLIDKNLVNNQKLLGAYGYNYLLQDYGVFYFGGRPLEGQKLSDVRDLILAEIEKLKKGDFDPELIPATVNNLKVGRIQQQEDAFYMAFALHDQYVNGKSWESYLADLDAMSRITQKDVVAFAKKWFKGNETVVYKETGTDSTIAKIEKPEITPVAVNRDSRSPFMQEVMDRPAASIKPVFLDYEKDIQKSMVKPGLEVWSVKNTLNGLFELYYVFEMGRFHQAKLPLAIEYLKVIGTGTKSNDQINSEFYKLAANFGISAGSEQVYVSVSGLQSEMDKSVKLLEELLSDPKADEDALKKLIAKQLKARNDQTLNKRVIFNNALRNWTQYGAKNPFNDVMSEEELNAVTSAELISLIKGLLSFEHRVFYYGPMDHAQTVEKVKALHKTPATLLPVPAKKTYAQVVPTQNTVFFVHYDMVQAEMQIQRPDVAYTPELMPQIEAFNTYYGSSMGSIVFQEIRESKALAYSAYAYFGRPSQKNGLFETNFYIGTQADKLESAMTAGFELLKTMPRSESLWEIGKKLSLQDIEATRITKANIMFDHSDNLRFGIKEDPRKRSYEALPNITIDDIEKFHKEHVNGAHWNIRVMGSKDKVNLEALKKFGNVVEISLSELFGYPVNNIQKVPEKKN